MFSTNMPVFANIKAILGMFISFRNTRGNLRSVLIPSTDAGDHHRQIRKIVI